MVVDLSAGCVLFLLQVDELDPKDSFAVLKVRRCERRIVGMRHLEREVMPVLRPMNCSPSSSLIGIVVARTFLTETGHLSNEDRESGDEILPLWPVELQ